MITVSSSIVIVLLVFVESALFTASSIRQSIYFLKQLLLKLELNYCLKNINVKSLINHFTLVLISHLSLVTFASYLFIN